MVTPSEVLMPAWRAGFSRASDIEFRELLDLSLVEVGNLFGGRDHSTVIHSINKVEEDLAADDAFHARVEALRGQLGG